METRFTVLLIEIGVAIVVQIGILVAILLAVKKTAAQVQSATSELQKRALPMLDQANGMLETTRPKVEQIVDDLAITTTTLKAELQRIDATVNDIVDRTRLQVIRADELVSRTMDRVEETTDIVHHTVISPVRQVAAIIQGITTGIGSLMGQRARPKSQPSTAPRDEMFI
ncbi:MAG TPA: hypothetical protein VFU76_01240 [Terriglobales bacterium]|nr:hypothetical protein [Terriglobales bacterium]